MDHSAEPRPIGRVTWTLAPIEVEDGPPIVATRTAILRTDGTWSVVSDPPMPGADVATAEMLGLIHGDDYRRSGPADGRPGVKVLHEYAAQVGGTVHLEPYTPDPPGTIY